MLVVIDVATGKTIPELTWSWATMGLSADQLDESVEVLAPATPHIERTPERARTFIHPPPRTTPLRRRPVISDLRAAIKERRPVRLASVALSSLEIEAECRRCGDWVD